MAIYKSNGSYQEVDNVYLKTGGTTVQRAVKVWFHNGKQFILVKGRMFEVVWEKDLSTWGGMSWGGSYNRTPYNNIMKDMFVLNDGSLMGVVPYVINNNYTNQYSSGRYALIKLDKDTGEISAFSTYTSWKHWNAVSGYHQTDQPIGCVKLGNYYVAYSEHGIFYSFNSNGTHLATYENSTWHTDGTAKYMYDYFDYGIKASFDSVGECIYYAYTDQNDKNSDSSSYMTSIYRIGATGSYLYTPRRHYSGKREARYYGICTNVHVDSESRKAVINFEGQGSSYPDELAVVSTGGCKYNSSTTDVSALCTLQAGVDSNGEYPVFFKDGYVYTIQGFDGNYVYKRSLSDLSLIWKQYIPRVSGKTRECRNIHQPFPACDGGFLLPNGCVVYPDGKIASEKQLFTDNGGSFQSLTIPSFCYDEQLGVGYMMNYYDGDNTGAEYTDTPFCKVIKLKEVRA